MCEEGKGVRGGNVGLDVGGERRGCRGVARVLVEGEGGRGRGDEGEGV